MTGSPQPRSSEEEANHLWLLLRVSLTSAWRRLVGLRNQSRLLSLFVVLFVGTYLFVSYKLFDSGFYFLNRFPGVGTLLTEPLLYLLFAFLFALLLISNLVIGYTSLFRNREAAFLLTQPVPFSTIFQWKLLESSVLASWAFLFLIAPLMVAYGHSRHVPWHFYPAACGMLAMFIVIPGVAGCLGAVAIARFMDRRSFQVLGIVLMVGVVIFAGWWYRSGTVVEDPAGRVLSVLDRMLNRTKFTQSPLLPSYWLTAAMIQWADGALAASGFYILVLASNALFFAGVCSPQLGRFFYGAAAAHQARSSVFYRWKWFRIWNELKAAQPFQPSRSERLLARFSNLAPDVRALIIKDARMFWRDTTQWVQTLMLFGLLAVYIFNIRYFSEQLTNTFWVYLVAFLNLAACSLNLATLTTRFVFPQFSLEGKRLWIVGMAPLGLVQVVRIKFWVATLLTLIITVVLMFASCHFLSLEPDQTILFVLSMMVMTLTLNALAVGIGTLYPNFREDNPSKIVSGFGGTLCLILSFLYILLSVFLLASTVAWRPNQIVSPTRISLGISGFILLSVLLGWLPLRLGLRRVRDVEI